MNFVPILIFVLVIAGLVLVSGRARRKRAAEQDAMVERIVVGTDIMTTSGLHGTVVAKNDDDTVQLSIAAGVEVKWELAALRDVASLPKQFRSAHREDDSPAQLDDVDGPLDNIEQGSFEHNVDLKKGDVGRGADPA